ncbi:MAG: D-alanyl-D-alanine carboxypeptidase [Potamolinea sp.]
MNLTAFAVRTNAKELIPQSRSLLIAQNPQPSVTICPAQLQAAIDAVISRPQLAKARWGIVILPLSPNIRNSLYNRDAERYFIPASNVKLLTTAAALRQLGSTFRIRTSVYGTPTILRLVGRGDPSLSNAQLKDLAQQLKRQGVRDCTTFNC